MKVYITAKNSTYAPVVASGSVDFANNRFNIPSHEFITGEKITLTTNAADPPAGLSAGTDYFVAVENSSYIKLSTTEENALKGTVITLTDAGTGNHTLTISTSGSYYQPYGWDEVQAAVTASTVTGTEDGVVILRDGSYGTMGDIANPYTGVTVQYEAENHLEATFSNTFNLNGTPTYDFTIKGVVFTQWSNGNNSAQAVASGVRSLSLVGCKVTRNSSSHHMAFANSGNINLSFTDCFISLSGSLTYSYLTKSTTNNGYYFRPKFYNCTIIITGNGNHLTIDCVPDLQGCIIYADSGLTGVRVKEVSTGGAIRIYNTCAYNIDDVSDDLVKGVITSDPRFVDAAAGDYELRPDSPCAKKVPTTYIVW